MSPRSVEERVRALIAQMELVAGDTGCNGPFDDEVCVVAEPEDLSVWCDYCLLGEGAKQLEALFVGRPTLEEQTDPRAEGSETTPRIGSTAATDLGNSE